MVPVPNAGFDAWVAGFRGRALAQGVSPAAFDAAFAQAGFLPGVIERDRNQTEFTRTMEDYLAIAASEERVGKGRAALARHGGRSGRSRGARGGARGRHRGLGDGELLRRAAGERAGGLGAGDAGLRGAAGELFREPAGRGAENPAERRRGAGGMTGSWAGAMGHTQFIPTSYLAYAVDFTGDGRRDIWSDDPTDALASTAAYLSRSGWRQGQPWGVEVRLPDGFSGPLGRGRRGALGLGGGGGAGHGRARGAGPWAGVGHRADGGGGPAFMVFPNFGVIGRYNNAENYMIGIGHLSDRLKGGPPVRGGFPPDAKGMTIADRRALQEGLTARGSTPAGRTG